MLKSFATTPRPAIPRETRTCFQLVPLANMLKPPAAIPKIDVNQLFICYLQSTCPVEPGMKLFKIQIIAIRTATTTATFRIGSGTPR